jgi:hypothetical protein
VVGQVFTLVGVGVGKQVDVDALRLHTLAQERESIFVWM